MGDGPNRLHPATATPYDHLKQLCPFHFTVSMGRDRIKIYLEQKFLLNIFPSA